MELGPILIGIAVVVLVLAPIVYMHRAQKVKEQKFILDFMALAEKQHVTIKQHEIWNNSYAIGLDNQANKLFYLKKNHEKEQTLLIDLADVEKCRVNNRSRTIKTTAGSSKVIDRLELVFTYKSVQRPERTLEFYNAEESLSLRGELPLVEKWCGIVNSNLKQGKKKKTTEDVV